MTSKNAPEILAYGCTYRNAASRYGSDALSVKVAADEDGRAAFGIIARSSGRREIADSASATAIKIFSGWFYDLLENGGVGITESDRICQEWGELHHELKKRVRNFTMGIRGEADVGIACMVINTSLGYVCLLDTMDVGVYRINRMEAEIISEPGPWSPTGFTRGSCFADEKYPKWLSTSLIKETNRTIHCDKTAEEAQISEPMVFLICTGEIAVNSSHEVLADRFRPDRLTGFLPVKVRLEELVSGGGVNFTKDISYNMGSAIIFRVSPSGDCNA